MSSSAFPIADSEIQRIVCDIDCVKILWQSKLSTHSCMLGSIKSLLTVCRRNDFRYVADVTHDDGENRTRTL